MMRSFRGENESLWSLDAQNDELTRDLRRNRPVHRVFYLCGGIAPQPQQGRELVPPAASRGPQEGGASPRPPVGLCWPQEGVGKPTPSCGPPQGWRVSPTNL